MASMRIFFFLIKAPEESFRQDNGPVNNVGGVVLNCIGQTFFYYFCQSFSFMAQFV
jgi:hypothetical protein